MFCEQVLSMLIFGQFGIGCLILYLINRVWDLERKVLVLQQRNKSGRPMRRQSYGWHTVRLAYIRDPLLTRPTLWIWKHIEINHTMSMWTSVEKVLASQSPLSSCVFLLRFKIRLGFVGYSMSLTWWCMPKIARIRMGWSQRTDAPWIAVWVGIYPAQICPISRSLYFIVFVLCKFHWQSCLRR